MLTKLMKYDAKRVYIVLIVFYILALLFAILTRLFLYNPTTTLIKVIGMFSSGAFVGMLFNIMINTLMRTWVVFKKTFYDDEAYLTHTLPIKKNTLYLSKVILSGITLLISIIVMATTIFIAYYTKDNFALLKSYFLGPENISNGSAIGIVVLIIAIFYAEMFCLLSSGFTGLILGNKMQNYKTAYSVTFGFITYFITQGIVLLSAFIVSLFKTNIKVLFSGTASAEVLRQFGIIALIIYIIIIVIVNIYNSYMFKKGVNVD